MALRLQGNSGVPRYIVLNKKPCHADPFGAAQGMLREGGISPCCHGEAVRQFAESTLEPFAPLKGKLREGLARIRLFTMIFQVGYCIQ
jgi:hypothetical protein